MNYRDLGGGLVIPVIYEEKLSMKEITSPFRDRVFPKKLFELRYVGLVGGSKLA